MGVDLKKAAIAANRFGLGPRLDTLTSIAADPVAELIAELRPEFARIVDDKLMTSGEIARALVQRKTELKGEALRNAGSEPSIPEKPARTERPRPGRMNDGAPSQEGMGDLKAARIYLEEGQARFDAAFVRKIGFVDRLVWFWSNHFCVSADKTPVRPISGAFEREAIRPHVLGKFVDMLIAVEQHPAMLVYLDNVQSIGPNSATGAKQKKGLNENLAREILELHTLGVRSVYSQVDVTNLAKVITGWTVHGRTGPEGGEFVFEARHHEPGAHTILGKPYAEAGVAQGIQVLKDVARNPATARHIATKFARHFIADEPPPRLVESLTRRFQDTGGDLREMAVALITAPEALDVARTKLKRPAEWMTSIWRAMDTPPDMKQAHPQMASLGEPLWKPPSPKGFPDSASAWIDGLAARLDVANQIATTIGKSIDARHLLGNALGPLTSPETRRAVAGADSQVQALTLLFMAPEFQRR